MKRNSFVKLFCLCLVLVIIAKPSAAWNKIKGQPETQGHKLYEETDKFRGLTWTNCSNPKKNHKTNWYFAHPKDEEKVTHVYLSIRTTSYGGWRYLKNHDLYFLCEDPENEWRYHYDRDWLNESNDTFIDSWHGNGVSEARTALIPLETVRKLSQCNKLSVKYGRDSAGGAKAKSTLKTSCLSRMIQEIDTKHNYTPLAGKLEGQ